MASAPQTLPPPRPSVTGAPARRRDAARREVGAAAEAGLARRHSLRLALCLPYLALAGWAIADGARPPADVALEKAAHAHLASAAWIAHAVPLLPVLVARVLPGGTAALVAASALCAGGVLQLVVARLVRAGLDRRLVGAALAGIAAMPLFWAAIGTSFAVAASLACIAVAFAGGVDFVLARRTSGGYAAGISLAGAVLCAPGAVGCVVALVAATFTVTVVRRRAEPLVTRSLTAVLVFPTLVVVSGFAFFDWRLAGAAAAPLVAIGLAHWPHASLAGLVHGARTAGLALACSPVFVVSGVLSARRRSVTGLGFAALPVALALEGALGLSLSVGELALVLALFGILVLARTPGRLAPALVCAALVAGAVCSTLLLAPTTPALHALGL